MSLNSAALEELPPASSKACCGKTAAPQVQVQVLEDIKKVHASQATFARYRPLIVILGMSAAVALLALVKNGMTRPGFEMAMQVSMGLFLTALATLKLFDVSGFAKSFALYDPIAGQWPGYGRVYPFIEAACGLFLIAGVAVMAIYAVLIPVLSLTALGIVKRLREGKALTCGCTGSTLPIPLGRVSVVENLVMVFMAATMLAV